MSEQKGSVWTLTLTPVEREHLVTLLRDAERDGSYYGNKDQYWRRHQRIANKLTCDPVARRDT